MNTVNMENNVYVLDGKSPKGPFTREHILEQIRLGNITPKTKICFQGDSKWLDAKERFSFGENDEKQNSLIKEMKSKMNHSNLLKDFKEKFQGSFLLRAFLYLLIFNISFLYIKQDFTNSTIDTRTLGEVMSRRPVVRPSTPSIFSFVPKAVFITLMELIPFMIANKRGHKHARKCFYAGFIPFLSYIFDIRDTFAFICYFGVCIWAFLGETEEQYQVRLRDAASTKNSSKQNISKMDELEKLHSLMEKGIISKEEFDQKKSKLLS